MAIKINGLEKPRFKAGQKVYVDCYGLGWVEKTYVMGGIRYYSVKFGGMVMGGILESLMVKC